MTSEQSDTLGHLYDRYYKSLCRYAYSLLNDWHNSEDMVQRTFEIACKKIGTLIPGTNPFAWLIGILELEIKNFWRTCDTRSKYIIEFHPETPYEHPDRRKHFDNIDYLKPRGISDEDFDLIKFVSVYGFTCAEAARFLGISESACYKRLQRAKKRMRKNIESRKE